MTETYTRLRIQEVPGAGHPSHLLLPITSDTRPFHEALADGRLLLQRCSACQQFRHPVAPVCPFCQAEPFTWHVASGQGIVHSWIRYHKCYLPEFEPLMPYCVLDVQLAEGPRMFGRLADRDGTPSIGSPVQAIVERWPNDRFVPAFTLAEVRP